MAVTVATTVVAAAAFGVVPAWLATRLPLNDSLRQAGRGAITTGPRQWLRRTLVVGQVAIALVLLTGAGLLIRSFARLQSVSPGFNTADAYVADTFLPRPQYSTGDQYRSFAVETMAEMATVPGVKAVAVANNLPFSDHHGTYGMTGRVSLPGDAAAREGDVTLASESSVSPDYFHAMGIPLLEGRSFDGRDAAGAARTIVISQSVARRFFPQGGAVGKGIVLFGGSPREVIGVVGDVKQASLQAATAFQVYQPFAQVPDNDILFVVRTAGPQPGVAAALRQAITRRDRNAPVYNARPLAAMVGGSIARQQFSMAVLGVFSTVALLLAAIGIYGVIAYSVSQRRSEIGLRVALGARPGVVARQVMSEGGRLVLCGVAIGLGGALLLTSSLEKLLFGVGTHDPPTFAAVSLLMLVVAVAASLVPAVRAARVDPAVALRGH